MMSTALDGNIDGFDAADKRLIELIKTYGWFVTAVPADQEGPGFSYTTGFHYSLGIPEIIIFGLRQETAHQILSNIFTSVKDGQTFGADGPNDDLIEGLPVWLLTVRKDQFANFLGASSWFYGNANFPCQQLIWPDRAGRFPWRTDFATDLAGAQVNLTQVDWSVGPEG